MAKKNLSEDEIKYIVSAETAKAQEKIHDLTKQTKELSVANRQRLKDLIELEAQGKKNTKRYKDLNDVYKKSSKDIANLNKQIAEESRKLDVNGMSMVQLRKHAKDLKKELDNVVQGLEPKRYAELEKELAKVNYRMAELKQNAMSIKEVAQSKGFWDFMAGTAFVKLGELAGQAVYKIYSKVKQLADESVEMARSADGVTHAFRRLDDGHILDNLRQATKGTVTDLDLMKAVVQANDFRIPLEDLGKYLQFAQLKAQQTGQSVDYMVNSIVTGLGRKSVMILDNLGLSAAEINEKIKQGADFTQAVADIVDKQLAAAGDKYVSAADRASKAAVDLKNKQLELGEALLPVKEYAESVYGSFISRLIDTAKWIVENRKAILLFTTAFSAYIAAKRLAIALSSGRVKSLIQEMMTTQAYITLQNRATAAINAFNTSMKANIIGLVTSLLATCVTAWLSFRKSADSATDSLKDANAELMNERRALSETFDALKKAGEGTDERRKLIEQVNSRYGEYLPNLLTEKSSLDEIEAAYRSVNNAMVENIVLKHKEQDINSATEEAAKTQADALDAIRKRVLQLNGATQDNAVNAQSAVMSMTATYQKAGVTWQKAFNSIYDSINAQFFGGKGLGSKASEELQEYVKSYYQMRKDIKAIDDKYAVWQQSNSTSSAPTTSTATSETTNNNKKIIKQQVADEQAARREALQQALEEENQLHHDELMNLRDLYLSQDEWWLQTKEQYNEAQQNLEILHLNRMLEIAGLSADQRRQIEEQLKLFEIQCLDEKRAKEEEYNREKAARIEQMEQTEKDSAERIAQKEQEEYKKRIATYKQYGQQLGDALGKVISGQEDMLSAFADTAIDMVFEVIEKVVEAKILEATATATTSVAKATAESFATTDSVMSFGASGAARAAVMSALIMGALAAAKSALKGMLRGSKSSSSSSSSSASKVTRSQVTATGRESGGAIDVRRRQDGRLFTGASYDPSRRGFIDRPTVIVGEGPAGQSKEWVASNAAVSNPTVAPLLQYLDQAQQAGTIRTLDLNRVIRARLAGFSSGGSLRHSRPATVSSSSPFGQRDDVLDRLADAVETLNRDGVRSAVVLTELERKQQLIKQSRQIASK